MRKESSRTAKTKTAKPGIRAYKLQVPLDAEERRMLDTILEDKRMPAALAVRQLILAEYRRLKGELRA